MKELWKNRKGDSIVEATILLPFCTVMIVALYFAAIYVCQKANLQANLQNTLIYYKNTYSDTYVSATGEVTYTTKDGKDSVGGTYSYNPNKIKNPYRFFFMDKPGNGFEEMFKNMCGHMFFTTPGAENIDVQVKTTNYVVYQALTVDVKQSFTPAINLSMVGVDNKMDIDVSGTVVISDGDDFIRNIDFAVDVLENTKIGKKLKGLVGKTENLYKKFKSAFGISDKDEKE